MMETTGVKAHARTHHHTHTNHIVYCTRLSPMRVMILLYLHGFSFIDLEQEVAPPAGAPFLGSPPVSYCACVCMCAKYQQLVCRQSVCGKRTRNKERSLDPGFPWSLPANPHTLNTFTPTQKHVHIHAKTHIHDRAHPHCWGISSSSQ